MKSGLDDSEVATAAYTIIPKHTATFSVNGTTTTEDFDEGASITFPTDPSDIYGKTFVGWTTAAISGTTDTAPTFVTTATMGSSDVTYYAVFATYNSGQSVTDELTVSNTQASNQTYTEFSNTKLSSDAVYAGKNAKDNDAIQLRSKDSDSGIITTTSGGKVTKISVTWNTSTQSGRTLNIYGKNSAYSKVSDLYNSSSQGTLLGTIVKDTSTELTVTEDYAYIGIRSNANALYLDKVSITWSAADYNGYCTTVTAPSVTNPVINVATTFDGSSSTTATITCETEGATIYYSYDNTTWQTYTDPLTITSTTTIYAKAVKDSNESETVSKTTTMTVATPTISVAGGTYNAAQTVTLSTTTTGATIYYTLDGTDPTSASTAYSTPITIDEDVTLKAIAVKNGVSSSIATATYSIFIVQDGVFDFTKGYDYGSGFTSSTADVHTGTWTAVNVTMAAAGRNAWYGAADFRLYQASGSAAAGSITFSVPAGNVITEIVFTDYSGLDNLTPRPGALSSGIWTGNGDETSVTFTHSGSSTISFKTVTVTYTAASTLTSIAVSGTPATLTVGDEFTTDGITVTATFENGTTKDVTALALYSGYDMETEGTHTVTVSYTFGEETKTTTYQLTVNPLPTYTVTLADDDTELTEASYQAGVTLPSRTSSVEGWTFNGWVTTEIPTVTSTAPTSVISAGTYQPTADITLYPVYTHISESGSTDKTITWTIEDLASEKGWTNKGQQLDVALDDSITASPSSTGNNGKYYTFDHTWRFYHSDNGTLTLTAATDATLKSATFTFTNNQSGYLEYDGNTITSGTAVTLSGQSATFEILGGDNTSSNNGQILFTAISVTYTIQGTPFYTSYPVALEYDVTISSAGYSTLYYSNVPLTVPEGIVAYTLHTKTVNNYKDVDTYQIGREGDCIAAGMGVILYSAEAKDAEAKTYTFSYEFDASEVTDDQNILMGSDERTLFDETGYEYFVLGKKDNTVGFYHMSGTDGGKRVTNGAHKCFFRLPEGESILNDTSSEAAMRGGFSLDEMIATAIEKHETEQMKNNVYYNLAGQRVTTPSKGIYIVNGKKVFKK